MVEHEEACGAADEVGAELLSLLDHRSSTSHFDSGHVVSEAVVDVLLQAAGRSPSAGNSQPWSFVVGRRDDPVHQRLVRHLAGSSSRWAPHASLLVVNLAHILVEDSDMEFSEFARYDLGQAVAHMTVQAQALGLSTHQFRAFDRDGIQNEFDIPDAWEVSSMAAIGRPAPPDTNRRPVASASSSTRDRHPIEQITWARHASLPS